MEQTKPTVAALAKLLDDSSRPLYAVDARQQIAYCNAALAAWLGLEPSQIVGRMVEYHSETPTAPRSRDAAAPLTDLCPPPQTMNGETCTGAVGCVGRNGRLVHRRAEFIPLTAQSATVSNGAAVNAGNRCGVLVVLATTDMRTEELSAELSDEPSGDELHRAIRRFRRAQATDYAVEALVGQSSAMQRVRAQVAAAAASTASVLIRGRRGSGRAHVGRAIHYESADAAGVLTPVECAVVGEESLRRVIQTLREHANAKETSTLLLLNVDQLPESLQSMLVNEFENIPPGLRIVATLSQVPLGSTVKKVGADDMPSLRPQLLATLSTIAIDVPPLAERLEDLPLLAQFFLEAANRGQTKQVGSLRPDAIDLLALYSWPGELDELRRVIIAAHAACGSHEITPADLPAVIHHASKAAALPRRFVEKIVLEDLLAEIECEIVERAMAQAGGNKSAAAELLGMTRPRLYRRLVQFGLTAESPEADSQ